jgi:uncharacterized protein (DUF433 family)
MEAAAAGWAAWRLKRESPGPDVRIHSSFIARCLVSCGLVRHLFYWQGAFAMKRDLLKRITIEPGKCGGRPCIRGMRIRVTDVLQLLSAGAPYEEILEDYPDLECDDILAAIEFAAHQTDRVVLQGV